MTSVPRLDLAPKLRRPLSVWNPLDYLRLLYWVFYFPQALQWYIDTQDTNSNTKSVVKISFPSFFVPFVSFVVRSINFFTNVSGLSYVFNQTSILRKSLESLIASDIQRNLFAQGIVFVFIASLLTILKKQILLALPLFITSSVLMLTTIGEASFMLIVVILILILIFYIFLNIFILTFISNLISYLLIFLTCGYLLKLIWRWMPIISWAFAWSLSGGIDIQYRYMLSLYVILGIFPGLVIALTKGAETEVWVLIGLTFFILRPDAYLLNLIITLLSRWEKYLYFLNTSSIPSLFLSLKIKKWFQKDWEIGWNNVLNLLQYSFQFTSVAKALNKVFIEIPEEQIIYRLTQLIESPHGWNLLNCLLASAQTNDITTLHPMHATAKGFYNLYKKKPVEAKQCFAIVRCYLYGEEIYTLTEVLMMCNDVKALSNISTLSLPAFPTEPLLRPTTWQALHSFRRIINNTQIIQNATSRAARAFALNRAIGEVTQIIDNADTLPEAERGLIVDIAQNWKTALERQAREVGQIEITKPVKNPYTVGDPVEEEFFVGRQDIMRQLEELWLMGTQMQSVVLYGHRRMGKTSILRNLSQRLGAGVKVAYVNLLGVGDIAQAEGEFLMAMSDAISQAVNVEAPNDDDLLNLPYPTFRRYLERVADALQTSQQSLIIALDEFEKIEELIVAGKISSNFMQYLRSWIQTSSKIGFALAGLHTLEEMTSDYFQPLYASFIPPIKVSFMQLSATHVILANPSVDDFPLDYAPEALDEIYALTHGQPFLVQLLGFQLVRRYNDQVFEMQHQRNPVFTLKDVETVVDNSVFFQQGRYYFDGVWGQAMQGASGQQAILLVLAPHQEGLGIEEITQLITDANDITIMEALMALQRHDVVEQHQGRWRIVVELFRRWILQLSNIN
ncbi:hypothetical protein CAL7716_004550 [Calothrix sp. PCC 7716]|nr:hypothetical protein CAL7716_004550 [Calothrix sp. PCC 7716]